MLSLSWLWTFVNQLILFPNNRCQFCFTVDECVVLGNNSQKKKHDHSSHNGMFFIVHKLKFIFKKNEIHDFEKHPKNLFRWRHLSSFLFFILFTMNVHSCLFYFVKKIKIKVIPVHVFWLVGVAVQLLSLSLSLLLSFTLLQYSGLVHSSCYLIWYSISSEISRCKMSLLLWIC